MRCKLVLSCVILMCLAPVAGAQNVRITWVGQACFIVQSEGGPTVVVDPPVPGVGYAIPNIPADVVTVSHNHGDHNNTAGVAGNFTLVDGRPITARTQVTAAGIPFLQIPGFHDGQGGAVTGQNTIVQWTQSGLRFAHFGDLGQDSLTDAQLADLQNLDVLFIPAGGFFTTDIEQAAAWASQVGARVTVLMHYRTALGGPAQLATLPAVSSPFSKVVYKPSSVQVTIASLPAANSREVWVMQPAASAVVVNSGGFALGAPVAPGSLATVFGTFSGADTLTGGIPLPTQLGQTRVLISGTAAPLVYSSPNQINLQIPSSLVAGGQYLAEVQVGGQTVARTSVTLALKAPGFFSVFNADGRQNSAANPARAGDVIQIYGTGQGRDSSTSAQADGTAAPASPQRLTRGLPTVTIGGVKATVRSSGLLAGYVGVWQLSVVVPSGVTAGSAVAVNVTYGSLTGAIAAAIQ